jgi:hypothetical protein
MSRFYSILLVFIHLVFLGETVVPAISPVLHPFSAQADAGEEDKNGTDESEVHSSNFAASAKQITTPFKLKIVRHHSGPSPYHYYGLARLYTIADPRGPDGISSIPIHIKNCIFRI